MDWNDEAIARLRALWDEGHSTAEIGRKMCVTKNAVVGKAHRLNLPPRPSPIRREGPVAGRSRVLHPRRIVGPTLPSLAADPVLAMADIDGTDAKATCVAPVAPVTVAAPPVALPPIAPSPVGPVPIVTVARSETAAAPARAVVSRPVRSVACCWPLGEPGTKSFRFCDAEASAGRPYCKPHALLAYVRVRDRREDAA